MKKLLIPFFLLFATYAEAQMNCPTFSRYGGYDRIEISPLWTVVETHTLAEDIEEGSLLIGGEYEDRSMAPGIVLKYFMSEQVAIRLKAVYMQRQITDVREVVDSVSNTHVLYDEQFDQVVYKIAPGFQWTFFDDHISFFGGIDVPYTAYGDWTQTEYILDEQLVDTALTETFNTRVVPGGYAIGLGAFGGFQYYFTRNFAAGIELAAAYQYHSVGGDITWTTVTIGSSANEDADVYNETRTYLRFTPVQPALFVTLRF